MVRCPPIPIPTRFWRCGGPYCVYGEDTYLFEWLKRLFSKPTPVADTQEHPISAQDTTEKTSVKPCKSCGKPISYDSSWEHIPNYCPECKAKYRAEHEKQKMVKRRCRSCGRTFTFPSTVKHYPNYCRECRAKFKEQK